MSIIEVTDSGLYCPPGDFYIDPLRSVERAVITHCHSDHARPGSRAYLSSAEGEDVLRSRLPREAVIETLDYGESRDLRGVRVSLHPAGHILGSSQVRLEWRGQVIVVSGDYKIESDATCTTFQPVPCDLFITESTFGLPVFRWPEPQGVFDEINQWWRRNQETSKASVLFAYAVGKAQRVLAGIDASIGPLLTHGAVEKMNRHYRRQGIRLPATRHVGDGESDTDWSRALILAPPSANGSPWMRRFGQVSTAFTSGWMQIRGLRRRRSVDRGFVLSDHVDWPGLLTAIEQTGAGEVWATHGYSSQLVRFLREKGLEARALDGPSRRRESTDGES